jgi:hypothetical protein
MSRQSMELLDARRNKTTTSPKTINKEVGQLVAA